jgi:hypothetical protein
MGLAVGEDQRAGEIIGHARGAELGQDGIVHRGLRIAQATTDRLAVALNRRPIVLGCSARTKIATRARGKPAAVNRSQSSASTASDVGADAPPCDQPCEIAGRGCKGGAAGPAKGAGPT